MNRKIVFAFMLVECEEIIFSHDMSGETIIEEIIDDMGIDIMDYPMFKAFVDGSLDWSDREQMYSMAYDLSDAYETEIVVVEDNN